MEEIKKFLKKYITGINSERELFFFLLSFFAIGLAIFGFIMFVIHNIVLIIFLAIIGGIIYLYINDEKNKNLIKKEKQNFISSFSEIIIDTNIWIMPENRDLLQYLYDLKKMIVIPKEVFEEIDKKKENGNQNGREGIRRVESFSKANLIRIENVTINMLYRKNRTGYADPEIIKLVLNKPKNYKALIITNDKKLSILGNQILKEEGYYNIIIMNDQEFKQYIVY